MRAALIHRYGSAAEVTIGETGVPACGPRQVLVRVRASSLNPLDVKLRTGELRRVMPLRFPAVLGFDLAGEVEAVGTSVREWLVGDRVYGRTDARTGGAHAELAAVGAAVLDRIPQGLSVEEAASLPLVAMTALQGLRQARVSAGDRILIRGASGGVGCAAVQIARAMGAEVTGICRGDAAGLVARLGASPIDCTNDDLAKLSGPFDAVLDTVGARLTPEINRVFGARGRYVSTGFSPGLLLLKLLGPLWSRRRFDLIMSRADGEILREVSRMVADGRLRPIIDTVLPFSRVAEAHTRMERGHLRGKVVLTHS